MKGLGDAVAAFISALGIKPCGGCKGRQEFLNRAVPFGENTIPEIQFDGHRGERALRMLPERDVTKLHQLHLADTKGRIFCLDFNRWFDNLEEFMAWVVPAVQALEPGEPLPAAPESVWRQYTDPARFTIVGLYALPSAITTSNGTRNMVICRGEFA